MTYNPIPTAPHYNTAPDFCISGAGSHWKTAGRSYGRNGVDDA